VTPLEQLRERPLQDRADRIISVDTEMSEADFEERGLVPEGEAGRR
jgi:hypothetical protein